MNQQELPIKNPCTQDWNTMEGGDRQRLCRVCDKPVHNLSAMTRQQAEADDFLDDCLLGGAVESIRHRRRW